MRSSLIRTTVGLLLASMPAAAFAQQSLGQVGNPASTVATQIAGRDATGNLRVPTIDASGSLTAKAAGSATLATTQVSVGTSATLLAAARSGRVKITVSVGAEPLESARAAVLEAEHFHASAGGRRDANVAGDVLDGDGAAGGERIRPLVVRLALRGQGNGRDDERERCEFAYHGWVLWDDGVLRPGAGAASVG